MRELDAIAKSLAPVVNGFVQSRVEEIEKRLASDIGDRFAALEETVKQSLAACNEKIDGIPQPDISEIASEAAALIPPPEKGDPGEKGEPGESIDPDTVREMLLDVLGPLEDLKGEPGEKGAPGDKGDPGESVSEEQVLSMVQQAVDAIELPQADKGEKGDPGEIDHEALAEAAKQAVLEHVKTIEGPPGRDALQIEILPSIDPEKTYPRGTFALHKGGIYRAYQQTQGLHGWECAVAGYPDISFELKNEREIIVKATNSDGLVSEQSYPVPAMIYRGVYQQGQEYAQGDCVTWGGSVWHCEVEKSDTKPGDNAEWKLCVKKGRDGK